MTRALHWIHPGGRIEIRLGGTPPISRLAVGEGHRTGSGALLHGQQASSETELPAGCFPLIDQEGKPVDLRPLLAEVAPQALALDAELILPSGHPALAATSPTGQEPEVLRALWVQPLDEAQAEALHARARLVGGLLIRRDESLLGIGSDLGPGTHFIHRLPRILFQGHDLIADNTDAAVSMGRLLEDFVQRFSSPERALPNVRVTTGYLYHHDLQRILRLPENERLQTLRVLFSGKTDARTTRALTSQLAQQLIEDVESAPTDDLWQLYRRALAEGRLVDPEVHLALLAHLYGRRLERLALPTDAAFPFNPHREFLPTHEQEEGVLALVQRLNQARVAFLADSVGLGKTATALGTVWYLQRHGLARHPVLIAPRKLHVQWQDDAARLHSPPGLLRFVNRHELERRTEAEARQSLEGAPGERHTLEQPARGHLQLPPARLERGTAAPGALPGARAPVAEAAPAGLHGGHLRQPHRHRRRAAVRAPPPRHLPPHLRRGLRPAHAQQPRAAGRAHRPGPRRRGGLTLPTHPRPEHRPLRVRVDE
ncbi:MAG TPA: hypothetical protein VLQ93_13050 [Myxococcaceae bacterium]|nr:hypothetical protein [Myxococcaceae bacterium]